MIFLGDSLTAGFGLAAEDSFPAVLQRRLEEEGLPIRMVNAGVSGDTSRGGLNRVDWLLGQEPDVLVVALGGNDGLRAQPVENLRDNLREIVTRAQDAGAEVLLLGVELPPNYGDRRRRAGRRAGALDAGGRRRKARPQPSRRHPPERRGPAPGRRERAAPPARAPAMTRA
ncbi:MAG: GDSL-type esterase/lipase family protein [Planctomycetota bacterium]